MRCRSVDLNHDNGHHLAGDLSDFFEPTVSAFWSIRGKSIEVRRAIAGNSRVMSPTAPLNILRERLEQ